MSTLGNVYSASNSATVSTAITVMQLQAASGNPIVILRAWVTQESSTTSAQTGIQLLRKTATITGSGATEVKLNPTSPTATATALHTATVEGTDGDILVEEGFNILNGWLYLPVPEERPVVDPSGFIALKFSAAPSSATYDYGFVWMELG